MLFKVCDSSDASEFFVEARNSPFAVELNTIQQNSVGFGEKTSVVANCWSAFADRLSNLGYQNGRDIIRMLYTSPFEHSLWASISPFNSPLSFLYARYPVN